MEKSKNQFTFDLSFIPLVAFLYTIFSAALFVSTEILSAFHLVSRLSTGVVIFMLLGSLWYLRKWFFQVSAQVVQELVPQKRVSLDKRLSYLFLLPFVLTGLQGFLSAPNTSDAMIYHLPRIMFWIEQGSIWQSTISTAHDFMPPQSGVLLMHLYLLFGGDRFLFFSQWFAGVVVSLLMVLISLWAFPRKQLQVFDLLYLSIPAILLQSSSTQIDLVLSAYVLISAVFSLWVLRKNTAISSVFLGLSVGMALATKPTFVFWYLPFALYLAYVFVWREKFALANMVRLVLAAVLALGLQVRWLLQNWFLYQTPLGFYRNAEGQILGFENEVFSLPILGITVIRNLFLHIPLPVLAPHVNSFLQNLSTVLGVSLNDPRTTWYGSSFSVSQILYPQEDIVGNPLQLLAILLATVIFLKYRKYIRAEVQWVFWGQWLGWLLFSLLLKWQPYHTRLQIPFFAILTALSVGVFLTHFAGYKKILSAFALGSYTLGLLLILGNVSRPFISYVPFQSYLASVMPPTARIPTSILFESRELQYFHADMKRKTMYEETVELLPDAVSGKVFIDPQIGFAYPWWVVLGQYRPEITITAQRDLAQWQIQKEKDLLQVLE